MGDYQIAEAAERKPQAPNEMLQRVTNRDGWQRQTVYKICRVL